MTPERAEYSMASTVDALVSALENQARLNELFTRQLEKLTDELLALSNRIEGVTRYVDTALEGVASQLGVDV